MYPDDYLDLQEWVEMSAAAGRVSIDQGQLSGLKFDAVDPLRGSTVSVDLDRSSGLKQQWPTAERLGRELSRSVLIDRVD